MAITKTFLTSSTTRNLGQIGTYLQQHAVPEYFASVTIDSENDDAVSCYDADGNLVLTFTPSGVGFFVTAYRSDGSSAVTEYGAADSSSKNASCSINYVYQCTNGIMMHLYNTGSNTYTRNGEFIITKNNHDETVIINAYSGGTNSTWSGAVTTSVKATAWTDVSPASTLTFHASAGNQTQLVPFCTDAAFNQTSYTPNAFYMPKGQHYSMGYGKIEIDGVAYLSNGYWAIKDV